MAFSRFRRNLLIRVAFLTLSITALALAVVNQLVVFSGVMLLVVALQLVHLVRYLESNNNQLASYVKALSNDDNSQQFRRLQQDPGSRELGNALNHLSQHLIISRRELEQQNYFLNSILKQSDTAFLVFEANGTIRLINQACQQLLGCKQLNRLNQLTAIHPQLGIFLQKLAESKKAMIALDVAGESLQLLANSNEAMYRNKTVQIVTLQNIRHELDRQEQDAWQKLIRVLTHEMVNSIAPIASLAATSNRIVSKPGAIDNESQADLQLALSTVSRRCDGLMDFIASYRDLSQLPQPVFAPIAIQSLFDHLQTLLQQRLAKVNFSCHVEPQSLQLYGDKAQLEQVMVNLLGNALDAIDLEQGNQAPAIELVATLQRQGKIEIVVKDNGCGILPEVKDKLFIPFFTTKANGSGIGLALCKQIVQNHGGTIELTSSSDPGSCFRLIFAS